MRRVSVVGSSGSGKSTLSAQLARRLGLEHVELDALFHLPGWRARPRADLRRLVARCVAAPGWVVDGNYGGTAQDLVWAAADTVVWLDLPSWVVLPALVRRTLRRIVRGEELWNGNRERWANFFDPRPSQNVILWSATRHRALRRRYAAAEADASWAHLEFVRLRSRAAAAAWLETLPGCA